MTGNEEECRGKGRHFDGEHQDQILTVQVRQIYHLAPIGFLATVMNAAIVFVIMKGVAPGNSVQIWLAAVLSTTVLRALVVLAYYRADPDVHASSWARRYLVSLALVGVAWGGISFIPFSFSLAHQVFLAFVLGGMAAGASSTFSKIPYGYSVFAVPAILPLAVHFFLIGDSFHLGMGAMALIYLLLLGRISQHNYAVNRDSLLLRFENRAMIDDLRGANREVDALNKQLIEEIKGKLEAEKELRDHHEQLAATVEERTADLTRANEQLKNEIEERKQVEGALRENRERLVLAQKAGRVGIFDWDMLTGESFWTAELEELFGLVPGTFESSYQKWASLVVPSDLVILEERLRQWIEERTSQVAFEYRFARPDGTVGWMAATAGISYDEDGAPRRMIGTNVDITEMKETQEKLVAAKNAAEAGSVAKGEFLANMSHEMRTPLAGVLGMVKLVLDMEIGAEERELLEMAKRSAESLLRLIEDVLDFSRLEAGVMKFERKPLDPAEVVRSAVEVVSLSARERGLRLSWKVEGELPEGLQGDSGRVRQVLVNLLGNAVKFTQHGSIEVSVRPFDDVAETREHSILFSIRDTGVGIPAGQLEKIFGKFTQIDSSLTRRYGGTGLGLALSRQIVEVMGGRIWVESSAGVGSTFYFTVPAR